MPTTYTLNDGNTLPAIGFGTYPLSGEDGIVAVTSALEVGYRLLDTAVNYGNEREVGEALRRSGVPREEVKVTSKIPGRHHGYADAVASTEESLRTLGLEYLDLHLIHWPNPAIPLAPTLAAMEVLKEDGRVRAIGVANFPAALLREAVATGAPIACNQVEYHVMLSQEPVLRVARTHDIAVTAYSPLGKGGLADDAALAAIGKRHGVTGAQIALAWLLEQDRVAAVMRVSGLSI